MEVEKVLDIVGEFGLYQKLLCFIFISYTTFICGVNYYTQIFIFATPSHGCVENITYDIQDNILKQDNLAMKDNVTNCEGGLVYNYSFLFPTITSQV